MTMIVYVDLSDLIALGTLVVSILTLIKQGE